VVKKPLTLAKETIKNSNGVRSGVRAGDSMGCPTQGAWHCPSVTHCLTK
jgi:hypothetical protein